MCFLLKFVKLLKDTICGTVVEVKIRSRFKRKKTLSEGRQSCSQPVNEEPSAIKKTACALEPSPAAMVQEPNGPARRAKPQGLGGAGGEGQGQRTYVHLSFREGWVFLEEGSNQPMPASHCSEDARLRQDASSLCLSLREQTESEKCTSVPELLGTVQRT